MGSCASGGEAEPLIKQGIQKKDEGGGYFEEDIEGEAWTDVPKRSCVILPGSTYSCPWDIILWRALLFATMAFITVWSIMDHSNGIDDDHPGTPLKRTDFYFWCIYLTHWGLTVETLYFLMALVLVVVATYSEEPDRKRVDNPKPWYMSLTFGLQAIVLPWSFLITALYWTLVFNPEKDTVTALTCSTHGANFVIAFLDFLVGQQPFFFAKLIWPLLFAASYSIFTLIYYQAGGVTENGKPYIYGVLNWANPSGVLTVMGGVIVAVVIVYLMYYGTHRVIKRYCGPPPLKG